MKTTDQSQGTKFPNRSNWSTATIFDAGRLENKGTSEGVKKEWAKRRTTVHYSARGQNTHLNPNNGQEQTTETHHNLKFEHTGHLSVASAHEMANKHAASRGLQVKEVNHIFHHSRTDD